MKLEKRQVHRNLALIRRFLLGLSSEATACPVLLICALELENRRHIFFSASVYFRAGPVKTR